MMRMLMALGGAAASAWFLAGCCGNGDGNGCGNAVAEVGFAAASHSIYRDHAGGLLSYTVSRTVEVADIGAARKALEKIIVENGGYYLGYAPNSVQFKVDTEKAASVMDAIDGLGKVTGRALSTVDELQRSRSLVFSLARNDREYNFLDRTISDRQLLARIRGADELLELAEYNLEAMINGDKLAGRIFRVAVQVTFENPKP